jgi:predicted transcriptional regulator
MSIKRGKMEIICEILKICRTGANKTQIVYQANLNFTNTRKYLDFLVNNKKFLTKNEENNTYKITEAGLNALPGLMRVTSVFMEDVCKS